MTQSSKASMRPFLTVPALLAVTVGLCAWDIEDPEAGSRVEFITRGAGDAVQVNKASQTIYPWPAHAKNRHLNMSGKRAGLAMQRYETDRIIEPRPLNPTKAPETPAPDNALQAPVPQQ
jgi:hypothetical protein